METAATNDQPDPWDLADFYDCNPHKERLSSSTPEEAIGDYLDGFMEPGCDVLKVIATQTPLEVTAFVRKAVDPGDPARWAHMLAEQLNEYWTDEEYGDPDGDLDGPGDAEIVTAFTTAIDAALKRTEVWTCEEIGARLYSEEEVVALMRGHLPHWFDGTTPGGDSTP